MKIERTTQINIKDFSIFLKMHQVGAELLHADRQTDGDEANRLFLQVSAVKAL
jgi:hypothetical protein